LGEKTPEIEKGASQPRRAASENQGTVSGRGGPQDRNVTQMKSLV